MNIRDLLSPRRSSLAIVCALLMLPFAGSATPMTAKPLVSAKPAVVKANGKGQRRYIIRLQSAPLALYRGDQPGLPATSPKFAGTKRLDVLSTASLNYRSYLERERGNVLQAMRVSLRREVPALRTYSVALHGFVAELTPAEAQQVAHLPGVAKVTPDRLLKPLTDRGPRWIRAVALWNGRATGAKTRGEGVVIGIFDTGINPSNPSFADVGTDGYDHGNPKGRRFGVCDPANPHYDPAFACNDKLIGAYDFSVTTATNPFSALDVDGHGSHTASTAAGNVVDADIHAPTTDFSRRISGVAPHANLIAYRVCDTTGCPSSSDIAAIEQAILDGVDVINHSIGSDFAVADSWGDDDALAFLAAHAAGIMVANAAGNAGPAPATLGSPDTAPWLVSVGAVSHDRVISNSLAGLSRGDGVKLPDLAGKGLTAGFGPAAIVYAGKIANPNDTENGPELCAQPYPARTFHGEIVVCDRGVIARVDKGANVLAGGAGGMVLVNVPGGEDDIVADAHYLPATHLRAADGQSLKNWLAQGSGHQGAISTYQVTTDRQTGDQLAGFSSRGPNLAVPDLLKPDLVAPGVDIFAAAGVADEVVYELMSGTSMASPHVAGAAALLKALHPGWSPDEIKSALMTTAKTASLRADGGVGYLTPFDRGSGRVDLSQAARAGLLLDEDFLGYQRANPALGGDPSQLNLPSMAASQCVFGCGWRRRVHNPGATTVTWHAAGELRNGLQLTVTPANFSLAPGASQTLDIQAATTATTRFDVWRFGKITLNADQAGIPAAHLPAAVRFKASDLPARLPLFGQGGDGGATVRVKTGLAVSQLSSQVHGMIPALANQAAIHQGEQLPFNVNVGKGARRLVAEILSTAAPDLDLYVVYDDVATGTTQLVCASAALGSREYCNVNKPLPGAYQIIVDGYSTTDASGGQADDLLLASAVVGTKNAGDLQLNPDQQSVAQGESFAVNLQWHVDPLQKIWYGAVALGTDSGNTGNLGQANVDLYLH